MPDPHSTPDLKGLRIYDGDELIFDGDDPSTYVICSTADDIARLLGAPDPSDADQDR